MARKVIKPFQSDEEKGKVPRATECPFCGERTVEAVPLDGGEWKASCLSCFAEGPFADTKVAAILKWNFRPSPDYSSAAS